MPQHGCDPAGRLCVFPVHGRYRSEVSEKFVSACSGERSTHATSEQTCMCYTKCLTATMGALTARGEGEWSTEVEAEFRAGQGQRPIMSESRDKFGVKPCLPLCIQGRAEGVIRHRLDMEIALIEGRSFFQVTTPHSCARALALTTQNKVREPSVSLKPTSQDPFRRHHRPLSTSILGVVQVPWSLLARNSLPNQASSFPEAIEKHSSFVALVRHTTPSLDRTWRAVVGSAASSGSQ